MRVQIIGAGLAGCSIAASLLDYGHEVGLYDNYSNYSGWNICTGKIFPAKSNTPLATRLNDAFQVYEQFENASPAGLVWEAFHNYVRPLHEVILYKEPDNKYKQLKASNIGKYVGLTEAGDVFMTGYQLNASGIVSYIRNIFPEHIESPDLTIYTRGAWERQEDSPFKVVPVRGITAEIKIANLDVVNRAYHWPAAGLYYVPRFENDEKFMYGTVMIPDAGFGGQKQQDIDHIIGSDKSYIMADWVKDKYNARISMQGAKETISAGYRPWIRGYCPGYFHYEDNKLFINGLYQSGAQMFFWLGEIVKIMLRNSARRFAKNWESLNYRTG